MTIEKWRDRTRPAAERAADLLGRMTIEEKVAQLGSAWVGVDDNHDGTEVAPHQHDLADTALTWPELIRHGLGQLTRPFGTSPIEPAAGAAQLAQRQREIVDANRFGIPAAAHDECLTGFTAWQATIYPTPLAWGATFNPDLVREMAAEIGSVMSRAGVHQGLAPVLDVMIDARWGRTEETISEDPYLVATIGTAYVQGLQKTGVVATLKHFVGYSASKAARNLAPAAIGPRQVADLLLPPFEMAIRDGGARSVMHSYTDVDGMPAAADDVLLTDTLRNKWGFTGTVVADYFGISFLELLHGVAGSAAEAGMLALRAGVDVELPSARCYGAPLLEALAHDEIQEDLVDRAARRVLKQKCELGLLDPGWDPEPPYTRGGDTELRFDPESARRTARTAAEQSIVLLQNDGILPLVGPRRIGVVGPCADDPYAMLGCYSFPSHVGVKHPGLPVGVAIPTVLESVRAAYAGSDVVYAEGCDVDTADGSRLHEAVRVACECNVCLVILGDRSGLFGRGTSGEGCDVEDLALPGIQAELVDAVLATRTPVVLVMLSGRPYALGAYTGRLAATVQAFFPGEEGGPALASVLSGDVNPSGRLPVSIPRSRGGQPATYLTPKLGARSKVSALDPTPLYAFGHGLSYTSFEWSDPRLADARAAIPTDGTMTVSISVTNTGTRSGTDVIQLYLHDPVAEVTRPVSRLVGYVRVDLNPGQSRNVEFEVHADLASFIGRDGTRRVEPGDIELRLGRSSADFATVTRVRLDGPVRTLGHDRVMRSTVKVG